MTPRAMARRVSRSARATFALGERLGRLLRPGDAVALTGDLGAGKTQLVRGICRGAGVPEGRVASPSFAIVASYRGRLPVHHADLYRIRDADELHGTGFFDLPGGEGAVLVEWADRVPGALPAGRLQIHLRHDARRPSVRHLELTGTGERGAALVTALAPRRPRSRPGAGAGSRPGSPGRPARAGAAPAVARGRGPGGRTSR